MGFIVLRTSKRVLTIYRRQGLIFEYLQTVWNVEITPAVS